MWPSPLRGLPRLDSGAPAKEVFVFGKHHAEVLVVGAGPVGLAAASVLTQRGIGVHIVDEEWRGTGFSYALALHPGSLDLLDDLGLGPALVDRSYHVERVVFFEGKEPRETLDLTTLETRHPFLAIVPQNFLEDDLEGWLRDHKVKVQWKHRLLELHGDDRPVEARLERWGEDMTGYAVARRTRVTEKVFPFQAELVLGADGHASMVRRKLGFEFQEMGNPEYFVVFEFECDGDPGHEVRIVLDEKTTSILWPLPGGRCRWSFQVENFDDLESERVKRRLSEFGHWVSPGLDEDRLRALIAERAPWFRAGIRELFWSIPIRFERRLASGFGRGAYWLAGDAAHLAGPAGIHSMNIGLREAKDLAERFEHVLRQGASELESYGPGREREWRQMFNADGGLQATGEASEFARRNATRILACTPASGAHLRTLLAQVGLELPD